MRTPTVQVLLRVGIVCLVLAALMSSGCARFDGTVDFVADRTSGKLPLSVHFTPIVNGSVHRYIWSFGDGQTSTERSPEHTYTDVGAYTVTLTVDPRRGEPTSARKQDHITVTAGFGSTPGQLVVEDDAFLLGESGSVPGFVNPWGETAYMLDVLENDVPGDEAGKLTIIGVSAYGDDYDDSEATTACGTVMINRDGTAIEYVPYSGPYDTFYYLATDGLAAAAGEVSISYSGGGGHAP